MPHESDSHDDLDNPAWAALNGPHSFMAEINGSARRYPPTVSPFAAVGDMDSAQTWVNFENLLGPLGSGVLIRREIDIPAGWIEIFGGHGVQMTGEKVAGEIDHEVVPLTDDDVPHMIDLVSRTEPGPFELRTIELGGYIGFKRASKLVAMAGCRLRSNGWREISAVCTDPEFQGQGLASRLVKTLVKNIKSDGEIPFLHASATNVNAIRLYETLGFEIRTSMRFAVLKKE